MKYISTRGGMAPVDFGEAVLMGMARDGGLLLPDHIPDVSADLDKLAELSYQDLACRIMQPYVDLPRARLRELVTRSYATFSHPEVTPVVQVGPMHVLELFHGPTLAFKDLALQFLGNLFEELLQTSPAQLNILGATSGDTGSAAIHGVRGRAGMRIFVMHPYGRVSEVQERQMTTVLDENVHNIAVEGTFDDCQNIMKSIFGDLAFRDRHSLGSINSINWARLLAQIVYYFHAGLHVLHSTGAARVRFAVPTGNFGDIFAGYLAARMGLPVSRLILASNENDILSRFFNNADYSVGDVVSTLSPSMDIQVASNFERYLYYRVGEDPERLRDLLEGFTHDGRLPADSVPHTDDDIFAAGRGDTRSTLDTIRRVYRDHGYLLDPHTAVGVSVGLQFADEKEPLICLATAHPAKFAEAIRRAVGADVAHHPAIDSLKDKPTRCDRLPASKGAVMDYIERITEAA